MGSGPQQYRFIKLVVVKICIQSLFMYIAFTCIMTALMGQIAGYSPISQAILLLRLHSCIFYSNHSK